MSAFTIVCGHYGCGKTNLTLNLALSAASKGEKVRVVDLDIVNPYFHSTDYAAELEKRGVHVISPSLAGSTLDSPSLSAEIFSTFAFDGTVFFDVGGDDAGATSLGRFAKRIKELDDVKILYVINRFRPDISTPEGAERILREIEAVSKLKITALVNNSHLCSLTTARDVYAGYEYAQSVAKHCGLPLAFTAVPEHLVAEVEGRVPDVQAVEIIVKPPFDEA